ncbi:hypothetical protein MPER_10841 [Moniliophthora perniciosa FA553]|nr:hypothetical protein MPER_10841 [Moniliophthora perniciosa FA553]
MRWWEHNGTEINWALRRICHGHDSLLCLISLLPFVIGLEPRGPSLGSGKNCFATTGEPYDSILQCSKRVGSEHLQRQIQSTYSRLASFHKSHNMERYSQLATWAEGLQGTTVDDSMKTHVWSGGKLITTVTQRYSVFSTRIGDDFIPKAFAHARAADPNAKSYYNDYGLEFPGTQTRGRVHASL